MPVAQALTVAETSTDPLCRKASQIAAKDIVLGSYVGSLKGLGTRNTPGVHVSTGWHESS